MTKDDFYKILHKRNEDCDGGELHLRSLWRDNDSKSLFYVTGIDFSGIITEPVRNRTIQAPVPKIIYE